jgi:hypothetical protein
MNTHTQFEVALETNPGKEHVRHRNPDSVPKGASVNERMQPLNTVRSCVPDHRTFETFIGGAGI